VAAAFDLFAAQGYDGTTVDAIAERAGIARRTFFRYFRSKDDVIFPDHDTLLASVIQDLSGQDDVSPVVAICGVVRLVFVSYVTDPQVSIQRYRLTRRVDALRDREMASVRKYERAFSRYLRDRLAGDRLAGDGLAGGRSAAEPHLRPEPPTRAEVTLHADVIAAGVVAAHNAVLREWLRAGGGYDPMADLETAFGWLIQTFEPTSAPQAQPHLRSRPHADQRDAGRAGSESERSDVVVAVFRADQPLGDVVERISRSL
jgi:AcrR family transcriptional regulator